VETQGGREMLAAYKGKCTTCGHDHGNNSIGNITKDAEPMSDERMVDETRSKSLTKAKKESIDAQHDKPEAPVGCKPDINWSGVCSKGTLGCNVNHEAPVDEYTDAELRRMWRGAGGGFHGPNVEHGTMPEDLLLPFIRTLLADIPKQAMLLCVERIMACEDLIIDAKIAGVWEPATPAEVMDIINKEQ